MLVLGHDRGANLAVADAAAVMLALGVVGENYVSRCWGRIGLEVRNFPEAVAEVPDSPWPRGLAMISGTAALVLGLVSTAVGLPGLISRGARAGGLRGRGRRAGPRPGRVPGGWWTPTCDLPEALPSLRPGVRRLLLLDGGGRLPGRHVAAVLPAHRSSVRLRHPDGADAARDRRRHRRGGIRVPIIFRPSLRSVEEIVVPSLTTAFYVNNAARNSHLVERRELTHVWLNHGDSEKPACYNPVHAIYDLLFAAGRAGVDRYARHGVAHPRGEVPDRRPAPGRGDQAGRGADERGRAADRALRADLAGPVLRQPGVLAADRPADRRRPCWTGGPGWCSGPTRSTTATGSASR